MGAVCGKGHKLNEENAPYDTSEQTAQKAESKDGGENKNKLEADDQPVEEDAIEETKDDDLKVESRPSAIKVQFPEQEDIQKFIDPEKSTTCFTNAIDKATLVAQKGDFFIPEVFHYCYGLKCCTCSTAVSNSCTLVFGFTFHRSSKCLCCSQCNAPLTGIKKKSDITITSNGQLFCDKCSVKESSMKCGACETELKEEDIDLTVVSVGRHFHPTCMKCCTCQLPLSGAVILQNDKLYCSNCYTDTCAPSCHHCRRKIVGRSLQIDTNSYHIDCVKCPNCSFKICDNEGVYIVEGSLPVHMDCSKSISSDYYKFTTDDEAGMFSAFEETDRGSDSDRGFGTNSAKNKNPAPSSIGYSSVHTSFSSLPFSSRTERPHSEIPSLYRPKNADQYLASYLKPERDLPKTQPTTPHFDKFTTSPGQVKSPTLPNGKGPSVVPNGTPTRTMQNGNVPRPASGVIAPRKIDSNDYSGPLAPVFYKKERERRRQEKNRQKPPAMSREELKKMSSKPSGDANGEDSDVAEVGKTTRVTKRVIRVMNGEGNGVIISDSDTENESKTLQDTVTVAESTISPTSTDTDTHANGDVADGEKTKKKIHISKHLKEYIVEGEDGDAGTGGGYVTEDDIDRMESGLGKEILREIKVQHDSANANSATDRDAIDIQQVPDDPIKASRSPDAKTEVQLPYFCEIKFGPVATGINRYCDSWLLEQAIKEPMSVNEYSNFMKGFHKFTNVPSQQWRDSNANSLADGTMSDVEGGMGRYSNRPNIMSGYRSDGGAQTDAGGYLSSPEMGRRKMVRYNSLDVRKAWYHERFLTYVQMYHRKGNQLFEQQKEACKQQLLKSVGSLDRSSSNLKMYSKERLFTNVNKKLPADVNRSRLELHLSDEEFVELFAMTQDQFRCLPVWKQNVLKQLNYLF